MDQNRLIDFLEVQLLLRRPGHSPVTLGSRKFSVAFTLGEATTETLKFPLSLVGVEILSLVAVSMMREMPVALAQSLVGLLEIKEGDDKTRRECIGALLQSLTPFMDDVAEARALPEWKDPSSLV